MPSKEVFIDFENFKQGLYQLEDTTKAPFGSARIMKNVQLTDRGGIGPRPGTELLGTYNATDKPVRGLYNFKKSFGQNELLTKAYDDELEVFSLDHSSSGWFRLKNGFTADQEFGFVTSLVNLSNEDYEVFCNRYEPYQGWIGAVTLLNGALVGAETSLVVDSVLMDEIFETKTASSSSATTLNVSTTPWAASQWVNLYVYIKSGTNIGKIRKITANTNQQITFDTLGSDPGSCDFEIRKPLFPASGSLIYNGTVIAYTAIPEYNKFSVASAHAAPDNTPVTVVPTEYPALPRGNRMTNYLNRIIVGKVRSAIARDSGGALQGYSSGGSYFVSKLSNPFDYSFTAARVAGEGDIVGTPYGGGEIEDVIHQEETAYVFKRRYIESVAYSQDANDLAVRTPLKSEIGSIGRVIKGSDDVYFITDDNRFTSLGRVNTKDIKPQTLNLGHSIKRLLDVAVFGTGKGIEDKNKIYIPYRNNSLSTYNDKVLIYNKDFSAFEGNWDINANFFERFNDKLYYGESTGPNVYELLTGHSDVVGTTRYPISVQYATQFLNLTSSKANQQALNSLYFEGYIKGDTTITFQCFKDLSDSPFLEFDFSGDEEDLLSGRTLNAFMGGSPMALKPIGSISSIDTSTGLRHFFFKVYFPFQYGNYFSIGFKSSGVDYEYDLIRFGMGLMQSVSLKTSQVKEI